MRARAVRAGLALLGVGAVALIALGCLVTSSSDCDALGTCGGGGGTTTSDTTTSTTSTVPPECSELAPGDVVGDDCGVFVSPEGGSDEAGDGSQNSPYSTLAKAVAAAPGKPVFVCDGTLVEALVVADDVRLLGGFACDTWAYTANKPTLTAPPDLVPVTVQQGALFFAQDFAIAADSAATPGTSSIAMFVKQGADVELTRVDLRAGNGAAGEDGATPAEVGPNGEGRKGENGKPGKPGCVDEETTVGGAGGTNACGAVTPAGGLGGAGTNAGGGDGTDGEPMLDDWGTGGGGAKAGSCLPGGNGKPGETGMPGAGATADGELSNAGFVGAAGSPGGTGTPGQGGGGGGGGKGCSAKAGPSGGGGGAGGCGGAGGGGGGAGGASIGLAVFEAKRLVLTQVAIETGNGGQGGKGADGQGGGAGGAPGLPGEGGTGACGGGNGGPGGTGGPGGGGRGGHSAAIVQAGTTVTADAVTYDLGKAGEGGAGGTGNDGGAGAPGLTQQVLDL